MRDDAGPLALGHYEPDKAELVTVVVRDSMESRGYGTEMLKALMAQNPDLKIRPSY
jgi:N-acetylglutamate synthase-like GNAT family acetyltransferase